PPVHGTVAATDDPTIWIYAPAQDYAGPDTVVVNFDDGQQKHDAMVTIVVSPVNDAPVARADSLAAAINTPLTIAQTTLLANDTDVDQQTLAVTTVGNAVHGSVSRTGVTTTFVPDLNFNGTATFDYTVTDGAATDVGTVSITVVSVPDPPIVVADAFLVAEDT